MRRDSTSWSRPSSLPISTITDQVGQIRSLRTSSWHRRMLYGNSGHITSSSSGFSTRWMRAGRALSGAGMQDSGMEWSRCMRPRWRDFDGLTGRLLLGYSRIRCLVWLLKRIPSRHKLRRMTTRRLKGSIAKTPQRSGNESSSHAIRSPLPRHLRGIVYLWSHPALITLTLVRSSTLLRRLKLSMRESTQIVRVTEVSATTKELSRASVPVSALTRLLAVLSGGRFAPLSSNNRVSSNRVPAPHT